MMSEEVPAAEVPHTVLPAGRPGVRSRGSGCDRVPAGCRGLTFQKERQTALSQDLLWILLYTSGSSICPGHAWLCWARCMAAELWLSPEAAPSRLRLPCSWRMGAWSQAGVAWTPALSICKTRCQGANM